MALLAIKIEFPKVATSALLLTPMLAWQWQWQRRPIDIYVCRKSRLPAEKSKAALAVAFYISVAFFFWKGGSFRNKISLNEATLWEKNQDHWLYQLLRLVAQPFYNDVLPGWWWWWCCCHGAKLLLLAGTAYVTKTACIIPQSRKWPWMTDFMASSKTLAGRTHVSFVWVR